MTSRRKKRPLASSIAPPVSTLHVVRNARKDGDASFAGLVFQVGVVVAILGCVVYTFLSSTNLLWTAHEYRSAQQHHRVRKPTTTMTEKKYRVHYRPQTATPPESSLASQINVLTTAIASATDNTALIKAAKHVRQGFTDYYSDSAGEIYQRGIWSPHLDQGTARLTRYLQQKVADGQGTPVFHVAILGNSAAAGYGNHRHEAYASRLQELIQPVFDSIGVQLQVSNWAMNDLTEFPLTWCLPHYHLQHQPAVDLMIWDFNGADLPISRFEAFLRQTVAVPFLMLRNGFRHDKYFQLLQYYHKHGLWQDVTVVSDGYAVQEFWSDWNRELPYGLAQWDHFGAPGGTPDKLHPHLSVQEHWLIAFLLSMRLLPSLEQVEGQEATIAKPFDVPLEIPLPLLLDTGDPWLLNDIMDRHVSCYSGFEHVARQADLSVMEKAPLATTMVKTNLPLLAANATTTTLDSSLLLKPKSVQFYHQGWVYDLEAAAKRSKQRTKQSDFLGFTDWKTAFYGEYQSGPLHLNLPVPADKSTLQRLVLCQADDPMTLGSCSISKDLFVSIQGQEAPTKSLVDGRVVKTMSDKPLCLSIDTRSVDLSSLIGSVVPLTVAVANHRIRWNQGPCSIAHVLAEWQ